MKLSHGWLQTGTVSAEHMAGTQLVTAGASKTSATSVNFLDLAKYTCSCRIQVMNLVLFLPPSSLNSSACSQQGASSSGIPCSARMLPVRLCGDRVGWWSDSCPCCMGTCSREAIALLHGNETSTLLERDILSAAPLLWSLKC